MARSPVGRNVAVALGNGTVHVFDPAKRMVDDEHGFVFCGHSKHVTDVYFARDGSHIMSASLDNTIRAFCAYSGKALGDAFASTHEVHCVALSPDFKTLIYGGAQCGVEILHTSDSEMGFYPFCNEPQPATDTVLSVDFAPNSNYWACNARYAVVLAKKKEIASDKDFKLLYGHSAWISRILFSPDGSLLATSSTDSGSLGDRKETRRKMVDFIGPLPHCPSLQNTTLCSITSVWLATMPSWNLCFSKC